MTSVVKEAIHLPTGKSYAIKILENTLLEKHNLVKQTKNEIEIMQTIRHPNVVNMIEVMQSKHHIYMVLELVTGGELFYKLTEETRFSEKEARRYMTQLLDGIEHCHSVGVCHRDLKPENLLLDEEDNIKISDFGMGHFHKLDDNGKPVDEKLYTVCGTMNYVAPEVFAAKGYNGYKADIWGVGCILYVLCAGSLPFDEDEGKQLVELISHGKYEIPTWFSPELKDLITHVLDVDPNSRYSIAQIRSHPWMVVGTPTPKASHARSMSVDIPKVTNLMPTGNGTPGASPSSPITPRDRSEIQLDAFDLISMLGTFDFSRMMTKASPRTNGGIDDDDNGVLTIKDVPPSSNSTRFTTEMPLSWIVNVIRHILTTHGWTSVYNSRAAKFNVSTLPLPGSRQESEATTAPVSEILFTVQFLNVSGSECHIIDVRKRKGKALEFYNIYRTIKEDYSMMANTSKTISDGVKTANVRHT